MPASRGRPVKARPVELAALSVLKNSGVPSRQDLRTETHVSVFDSRQDVVARPVHDRHPVGEAAPPSAFLPAPLTRA